MAHVPAAKPMLATIVALINQNMALTNQNTERLITEVSNNMVTFTSRLAQEVTDTLTAKIEARDVRLAHQEDATEDIQADLANAVAQLDILKADSQQHWVDMRGKADSFEDHLHALELAIQFEAGFHEHLEGPRELSPVESLAQLMFQSSGTHSEDNSFMQ